ITCSSQIELSDIQDYLQKEAIDEEATFTTEFKETWQTFISDCFLKMVEETLDEEKKLVRITDLDCLTLNYDIYDAEGILNLNDADFKALLKKELDNKDSALSSNLKNSSVSINNDFEYSIENDSFYDDIENSSDDFENSSDNFGNSSDDLGDVLINNFELKNSDNSNNNLEDSDNNILIDDNPPNQKTVDGSVSFEPFNGEYGPYFTNFTEQKLFL
ncbi:21618_t:CDS:2, partial [Cetraspora pellucida]